MGVEKQDEVKMKKTVFLGALTVAGLAAGLASAGTLDDVKARGVLNCGVTTGVPAFAEPDANGVWEGFDVAVCRAVAAAVLGDNTAVEFVPTTGKTRFHALWLPAKSICSPVTQLGQCRRDVDLKFEFVGVNYYDGQGFMVPASLGVSSAAELDGATVCIQTGTTTELNLADYFRANGMSYEPVPIETRFRGGSNCSSQVPATFTRLTRSALAAQRANFPNPDDYVVLPDVVSKEPLGPLVRHGDNDWGDIARWTLNALITAEELGVTSDNIAEMSAGTNNPEINRLLGSEGTLGEMLGLDAEWAKRAIMSGGNYGEVFESNIGAATNIGLSRGLNAQWKDGGLIYSPPFR